MLFAMIAVPLLLAAYYSWTSKINHFFFFGRRVPAEFAASGEGKRIVAHYRLQIWLGCVVALGAGYLLYGQSRSTAWLWAVLIEVLVFNFAFAQANRATTRLAPALPAGGAIEVPLAPAAAGNPPSMVALLAPLATGVGILVIALARVAQGSSLTRVPQALDALVAARGGESMFSFGMGLAVAGLAAVLIRKTARSRTPLGCNALWSSVVATWAGVAIMTFAIASAFAGRMMSRAESKAVTGTVVALAVAVVLFRTVANRRYVPPAAEMQTDDSWRWGLFYVNRNDPALFVQCRCGAGYTLNYGRVMAWPISAIFLGCVVMVLVSLG